MNIISYQNWKKCFIWKVFFVLFPQNHILKNVEWWSVLKWAIKQQWCPTLPHHNKATAMSHWTPLRCPTVPHYNKMEQSHNPWGMIERPTLHLNWRSYPRNWLKLSSLSEVPHWSGLLRTTFCTFNRAQASLDRRAAWRAASHEAALTSRQRDKVDL